MLLFNHKPSVFNLWVKTLSRIWGIGLLLLSACASATSETPGLKPDSTQTESPTLTPAPTELSGPSFTNPVYKNDFPIRMSSWSRIRIMPMGPQMAVQPISARSHPRTWSPGKAWVTPCPPCRSGRCSTQVIPGHPVLSRSKIGF